MTTDQSSVALLRVLGLGAPSPRAHAQVPAAQLVEPTVAQRQPRAKRAELAAVERFLEFFAARIANRRTRAAYGRAVGQFLAWCEARGLALEAVSPLHVAA